MTQQPYSSRRLSTAQNAVLDYLATGKSLIQAEGGFKDDHGRRIYSTTLAVLAALDLLEPHETPDRQVKYRLTAAGRAYVNARNGIEETIEHTTAQPSPAPAQAPPRNLESLIREEAWRIAQERGDGDALGHWLEAERRVAQSRLHNGVHKSMQA